MRDAVELAGALASAIEDRRKGMDESLRAYEIGMWDRMVKISQETWDNLQALFSMHSPDSFVRIMSSHGPPPEDG